MTNRLRTFQLQTWRRPWRRTWRSASLAPALAFAAALSWASLALAQVGGGGGAVSADPSSFGGFGSGPAAGYGANSGAGAAASSDGSNFGGGQGAPAVGADVVSMGGGIAVVDAGDANGYSAGAFGGAGPDSSLGSAIGASSPTSPPFPSNGANPNPSEVDGFAFPPGTMSGMTRAAPEDVDARGVPR